MKVRHESSEHIEIFYLSGDINTDSEDNLKLLLMKAVHSLNRSVINFRDITYINHKSLKLLNKAYHTSIRLNNKIIMTEIPRNYISEIFYCELLKNPAAISDHKKDSGKDGVLRGVN
ncbi:MAG: hypothetical protein JSW20_06180 [Nitrospiraceae bacterium]|nr:MAG: hypothetical protein JSW20_06180 [Nitrospiraceae bacterium]